MKPTARSYVAATPAFRAGTDLYWSDTAEFTAFVKSELVNWTAMIKEAGIEPE